jgi:hypothetical protein
VRAGHRLGRVLHGLDAVELKAGRRGDDDLDARQPTEDDERARDVVAIPDVREPEALEAAERLAQGQEVGQRLARVVAGAEHVEHRDRAVFGELLEDGVGAGAHADGIDVARQHERGVPHRLAPRELHLVAAQDHRVAAELDDPGLERHARARRRLLEHERHDPFGERVRRARRGLQLARATQQPVEVVRGQLRSGEEVARQGGEDTSPCWC